DSIIVARASFASRKQPDKYLAFHFALMDEEGLATANTVYAIAARVGIDVAKLKADMADKSVDDAINIAHKLALKTKIDGTPTFIFNGKVRAGAVHDTAMIEKLMRGEDV
ncbi:MAG: DsbA family protein, partial [Alphaproteobacteria bacterium]|nr:DsbA family protein [Alphaproteobacteria bacterium]